MTFLTKWAGRFTETEIDDEIIVMHLGTGEFFSVVGTAAAIWRLIDGTRDRSALIAALSAEFEADDQDIAVDVDEFISRLQGIGLLAPD
jgi:hypothetical protein